jgi:3-methyladenine DNA glycosylase AlkC
MAETPYIYYKFLGINSFIKTLDDSDTSYTIYDDSYDQLFNKYQGILGKEDTLKTGFLSKEGQHVFFTEIGIKITKSYISYFVYIFDHHPTEDEVDFIINRLEATVDENLNSVDPADIASNISDQNKGGDLIN